MSLTIFGPGVLFVRRTDVANTTPINIGKITEFSLDESVEVKPLYGQDNYPLAVAQGQVKSKGKMKPAVLSANALNAVFYGITPASGSTILVPGESGTVPAVVELTTSAQTTTGTTLTFTATTGVVDGVTVTGTNIAAGTVVASHDATTVTLSAAVSGTVANGATITFGPSIVAANGADYVDDLGVIFSATGLPLKKVASAPAAGQYSVNTTTGTYTFAAANAAASVKLAYTYSSSATTTQTVNVVAKPIGQTVTFEIYYATTDSLGLPYFVKVYQCVSEKLTQGFKMSDWKTQEVDFDFFQNAAGKVMDVSYGDVS
jgi:hypothetical protein